MLGICPTYQTSLWIWKRPGRRSILWWLSVTVEKALDCWLALRKGGRNWAISQVPLRQNWNSHWKRANPGILLQSDRFVIYHSFKNANSYIFARWINLGFDKGKVYFSRECDCILSVYRTIYYFVENFYGEKRLLWAMGTIVSSIWFFAIN